MSSSTEDPSYRNWLELPPDITAAILHRLGTIRILMSAQWVCTQWQSICREPSFWRTIDLRRGGYPSDWDDRLVVELLCSVALHLSSGGLVDISIEYDCTDILLRHITASCTEIKRLRLADCHFVSNKGLCEAAAKLPLLEDLELSLCKFSEQTLEAVGHHCPRLKSLKLNHRIFETPNMKDDEEALAIGRTMPELRHLQLFGNMLTNVGLGTILNGCPHLEYLDLRRCVFVDLTGELGKRCSERIKDIRRPLDSPHDYQFRDGLPDDDASDEDLYECDDDFCSFVNHHQELLDFE